ncbi:myosin light chain kinase [Nannochloropsis gaditana]|uniref:phosphorylase kinase n=1 Tax=Nannochloropsis gaditana TaxID=72520 RepID=W7T249_9STRA|nr:myosin light chain kinase [Nannochloropsis gaditana]
MGNCIPTARLQSMSTKNHLRTRGHSSTISDASTATCSSVTSNPLASSSPSAPTRGHHPSLTPCQYAPVDVTNRAAVSLVRKKAKQSQGDEEGMKAGGSTAWKQWGLVRPRKERIETHYCVGKKLGEGHTAVVRECVDRRDGKRYAMKIFTKAKLALLDVSGMLEEVSILWHLKHPNVIRFHDVLEDERHYYLVTEYMAGGELFDRITQKSTYTEKEARDLFKVLVSAIEYMHSMDVVHRDLKPENLLLADETDDVQIKIADFGYAVRVNRNTLRSQCGTPCYVAPEILRREPYGKPVDMWSIGVIIFILLAGYAPFYDEDHRRLFNKIKKAKFQFEEDTWENISVEAQDLISGLLCVDPAQRLTPSQALAHPWVMADDELLRAKKLTGTQAALKRFNARRKFRASVHSVIMANKLLAVARERSLTRRESDCSASEEEGREKAKDLLPCLPVGLVQ